MLRQCAVAAPWQRFFVRIEDVDEEEGKGHAKDREEKECEQLSNKSVSMCISGMTQV